MEAVLTASEERGTAHGAKAHLAGGACGGTWLADSTSASTRIGTGASSRGSG